MASKRAKGAVKPMGKRPGRATRTKTGGVQTTTTKGGKSTGNQNPRAKRGGYKGGIPLDITGVGG